MSLALRDLRVLPVLLARRVLPVLPVFKVRPVSEVPLVRLVNKVRLAQMESRVPRELKDLLAVSALSAPQVPPAVLVKQDLPVIKARGV